MYKYEKLRSTELRDEIVEVTRSITSLCENISSGTFKCAQTALTDTQNTACWSVMNRFISKQVGHTETLNGGYWYKPSILIELGVV